jgi:hypothetical protein
VAAGPGGGPLVLAYNGLSPNLIDAFFAFAQNVPTGAFVA